MGTDINEVYFIEPREKTRMTSNFEFKIFRMDMQIFTEKEEIEFLWDWPDQNDYRVIFSILGWRLKMGVSFGHFLV